MTERELTRAVADLCAELGLLWHHCRDARTCEGSPGLPDLLILGERGLILAELKAEDGNTTVGQHLWLRTAARIGATCDYCGLMQRQSVYARVWRPADLDRGEIRRQLEAIV